MSETWHGRPEEVTPRVGPAGWMRVLWRGGLLGTLTFGCLGLLLLTRLVERPLFGLRRPITPQITRFVCRNAFRILGIGYVVHGAPMKHPGAMVANHTSWLDIFALNAPAPIYFVSKSEVAGWPGIGWLARATGTVFIRRDRREAREQTEMLRQRLAAGHQLLFFPEGTSTDGLQVIPFKSTLFQAFLADGLREKLWVQPISVVYHPPPGEPEHFYGWWGDMDFGSHLLKTLAAPRQGRVSIRYHAALRAADFPDRKSLSRRLEDIVREGHAAERARHVDDSA